jgi:tetratricopeptide (TPR) repeat protein
VRAGGRRYLAQAINNLASALVRQGKLDEAEPMFREALLMRRKTLSYGHPELRESLGNLAYLLESRGDFNDAEPLHREFLEMARDTLPEDHIVTAGVLERLGTNLMKQDKLADARGVLTESLSIRSIDVHRAQIGQLEAAIALQRHFHGHRDQVRYADLKSH